MSVRAGLIAAAFLAALGVTSPGSAQTPLWRQVREPARLVAPATSGRERIGDVELHYAVYGKGRPVILLHDALGHGDHWGNQVGPLSISHQVIVVDVRGHGRSTRGDRPLSYRQMADDILGLMRKLRLREATVVGWGDGAITGLDLAMRHPGRVRKLVMFGGNYDRSGLREGAEGAPTLAAYTGDAVDAYKAMSPAPDLDALFRDLRAMWKKEPHYEARDLGRVRVPVTVMYAEHDEMVKAEHSKEMAGLIPGAELLMLPGVSHFAPWQDSRRFNDALLVAVD